MSKHHCTIRYILLHIHCSIYKGSLFQKEECEHVQLCKLFLDLIKHLRFATKHKAYRVSLLCGIKGDSVYRTPIQGLLSRSFIEETSQKGLPRKSEKIFAPELFRPHITFPDVPYDSHVRSAAERFPECVAMVYQNMTFNYREIIAMINGAAPLPSGPARKLQEKTGVTVVQGYGLTKASPLTHAQPFPAMRLESIGLPIHNTEQKIMDIETGTRELPVGEDGEIVLRGPQVMQGYWKAPEETARALRDGWLYTGDIGHVDEEGFTYTVDRKKEMIKYQGFGVAPAEIEALLLEHPAVLDSAVIGVPDDEAVELIKGLVVIRPGHDTVTPEDIVAFANGKLAGYKRVHCVEFISAIPKTASGKILRRELKEREKTLHQ